MVAFFKLCFFTKSLKFNNSIYITLTSISLLPSEVNSISLRLIIIKKNLAFPGSAQYSCNIEIFLGVM